MKAGPLLSPATSAVYDAAVALVAELGHSPTRKEIAARAGFTRNTVAVHLEKLAAANLVRLPTDGRRRGLVVLPTPERRAS